MKVPSVMRALAAVAAAALLASGCGADNDYDDDYVPQAQPVAYAPAAYGPPGTCYYVEYPEECQDRRDDNGVLLAAMLMPLAWHAMYAPYYGSPAYVNSHVPSKYRTSYVSKAKTFESANKSLIASSAKQATWKGSDGKTVSGSTLGKTPVFKAGNLRSSGYSSGSLRQAATAPKSGSRPGTAPKQNSGSSPKKKSSFLGGSSSSSSKKSSSGFRSSGKRK